MVTATATAHLTELHSAARPGESRARADLVATAANLGGIGLGPLVAGLLAQYAPDPLRVPYVVFVVLMLAALLAVALAPETVDAAPIGYRPQRMSIPAGDGARYVAATAAAMAEFALFGLFTSLAPSILSGTLHQNSHALAGATTFVVFGTAALGQTLLARAGLLRQLRAGFAVLGAGLVLLAAGAWLASLPVFMLGGAVAGGGAGVAFKGSVSTVISLAPAEQRGEALAGMFLAAYVGLAVPALALGLATQFVSARVALLWFALMLLAVFALVGKRLLDEQHP
jgi:hypothetical protein